MEKCFFTGPLYNLKDDKEFIKIEPLKLSKIDITKLKIVEPTKKKEPMLIYLHKVMAGFTTKTFSLKQIV